MENKEKPPPPPPPSSAPDSASQRIAVPNSEDHIPISPPLGLPETSPADSGSSPSHSERNSEEHISLSPGDSPARSSLASDHINFNRSRRSSPEDEKLHSPRNKPSPPTAKVSRDVFKEPMDKRVVLADPMAAVERATVLEEPKAAAAEANSGVPVIEVGGIGRRRYRPSLPILSGAQREKMVKKAALGFRVLGVLFCLVSFSVMAADRNQGWAIDSFERYIEFRYCMSVNVIGFVYSAAQAFDLSYNLATGKYIIHHHHQHLRYYFDFAADQIIAYLLISASSSAATRVDDWQSNWGKDKFPDMATGSTSMSFLAFVAFAVCSLISGYALCTFKSV